MLPIGQHGRWPPVIRRQAPSEGPPWASEGLYIEHRTGELLGPTTLGGRLELLGGRLELFNSGRAFKWQSRYAQKLSMAASSFMSPDSLLLGNRLHPGLRPACVPLPG